LDTSASDGICTLALGDSSGRVTCTSAFTTFNTPPVSSIMFTFIGARGGDASNGVEFAGGGLGAQVVYSAPGSTISKKYYLDAASNFGATGLGYDGGSGADYGLQGGGATTVADSSRLPIVIAAGGGAAGQSNSQGTVRAGGDADGGHYRTDGQSKGQDGSDYMDNSNESSGGGGGGIIGGLSGTASPDAASNAAFGGKSLVPAGASLSFDDPSYYPSYNTAMTIKLTFYCL
jgi:hypothetical protein